MNVADGRQIITPKQLLEMTETMVRGYHKAGHLESPKPQKEDIWIMLDALNFHTFVTPSVGHETVRLLEEKYGEPQAEVFYGGPGFGPSLT